MFIENIYFAQNTFLALFIDWVKSLQMVNKNKCFKSPWITLKTYAQRYLKFIYLSMHGYINHNIKKKTQNILAKKKKKNQQQKKVLLRTLLCKFWKKLFINVYWCTLCIVLVYITLCYVCKYILYVLYYM